jgi:hypothetical protein
MAATVSFRCADASIGRFVYCCSDRRATQWARYVAEKVHIVAPVAERNGMKKISSGSLFFTKKVFPVLWFGILVFVLAIASIGGAFRQAPLFFVVPCLLAVFGYVLMRKLVWDLVDEVYDCGNFLLVRSGGEEERIPLSNIMNVSAAILVNPPRITLTLVKPCKFGSQIDFSPVRPFSLNPFAGNEVAEDLIVRAYKARSGA